MAALDVVLADGERVTLGPGAGLTRARAADLATRVAAVVLAHAEGIRARFPKTIRRNAGYGLDLVLKQLDAGVPPAELDLTGLLCGSEGTLAVTVGATLKLHPTPLARGLAVASFPDVDAAIAVVPAINATGATAVELLDEVVMEAAAGNAECRRYLSHVPSLDGRPPAAVLQVEYEAFAGPAELDAAFARLAAVLPAGTPTAFYPGGQPVADLWALRKAAEPLLHGIGGGPDGQRKPHTFVEDNAVPVERLGEFVRGFRRIVERHGTTAAYYAHASVGVLHVRPLVDLHAAADRDALRSIASDVGRPGPRLRRRHERRARRRPGPRAAAGAAVRPGVDGRLRPGEGDLRPRRPAQPRQHRLARAGGRASPKTSASNASGSGPSWPASTRTSTTPTSTGSTPPWRSATGPASAARPPAGPCAPATGPRSTSGTAPAAGATRCGWPSRASSAATATPAGRPPPAGTTPAPSTRCTCASAARPARASARATSTWPGSRPSTPPSGSAGPARRGRPGCSATCGR